MKVPKPILKWVGGKTQIIENVIDKFPSDMETYHEPFLGGGSVLFAFLHLVQEGKINVDNVIASDCNEALISVYKNIQNNKNEVYSELKELIKEYNRIDGKVVNRNPETLDEAVTSKESYYYFIRKKYNLISDKTSNTASSMFIFLNKTCFRGVYRVGPNGFNVPYGNYTNPEIINEEHLEEIHELIQGVTFECCDFTDALSKVKPNDFVYLDPPYVPVSKGSFVGYNSDGFNKHQILFDTLKEVKYNFVMSNSDVDTIKQQFKQFISISAKRSINSKNPESKVKELLIYN
jgi:DNA adenine methylase